MSFRFVHMADVHLDTPFQNRESRVRALLRDSVRQTFKAGVDLALSQKVNALLIAGDLFDNETLSFATEKFLLEQMHRLQAGEISVYYAPGNHDPYAAGYRASQIPWPANVHVFNTRQPGTCEVLDSEGRTVALVSGAGHAGTRESENLAKAFPPAAGGVLHVGLLHALVSGTGGESEHERYAPCALADLAGKGYTYWALGHIHTRSVLLEKPLIVYPGNLVGRNPREDGPRGAYLVEVDDGGRVKATFQALAPVCWAAFRVSNLSEASNLENLERQIYTSITKALESGNYPGKLLLRVTLEGPCPLYRELQDEENLATLADGLQTDLRLEYLELAADAVVRPIDPDSYRNEPHVLSTVLALIDALKTNDELLLELAPRQLAGCARGRDSGETLSYLRTLLPNLEYEAASRLLGVDRR